MLRSILAAVAIALAAASLAACGGDDEEEATPATPGTGQEVPFDRAFIDGMVPHHREAIEMANAAKAAGLMQPELIDIANAIIATQQSEIDQMLGWREEWFGSGEVDPNGAEALGLAEDMMGMQQDAGDLATAEDVDQAFAAMMIDHHEGAIAMAELAKKRGQHAEVREVADSIITAQQREIDTMQPHAAGHAG